MPRDRLRSPRAGHGRKTTSLSDFEYRVWDRWQTSADCFGVMRCWPNKLMADDDNLAERVNRGELSPADIQAALERLIAVGLAVEFGHQGKRYICDPTWQDFQKVEYPHVTLDPKPDQKALRSCSESTRKLFGKHPGGRQGDHKTITKRSPDSRVKANSKRLKASGLGQTAPAEIAERFERFWAAYPRREARLRAEQAFEKHAPDEALLARMLAAIVVQRKSRDWTKDNGDFIPHPATWLNNRRWEDVPREVNTKPQSAVLPEVAQLCASAGIAGRLVEEWFVGTRLISVVDHPERRRLIIPDPTARTWIAKHYSAALLAAVAKQQTTLVIVESEGA